MQAKEETLREFFSDIGGVTAIRLLKDKFTGKLRVSLSLSHTDAHILCTIMYAYVFLCTCININDFVHWISEIHLSPHCRIFVHERC